jgi:hypothetical protein
MTRITSMPDVLPAYPYSELAHIRPAMSCSRLADPPTTALSNAPGDPNVARLKSQPPPIGW